MKLLAVLLLTASATTFASATQLVSNTACQSPLVTNGQCIGLSKKKFSIIDCKSKFASTLKINTEGKLCYRTRKCLTRKQKKSSMIFVMSQKSRGNKIAFVIFKYDVASNSLKVTAPNWDVIIFVIL